MDEGRIVEQGKPVDVLDRPKEERTRRFLRRTLQLAESLEELSSPRKEKSNEASGRCCARRGGRCVAWRSRRSGCARRRRQPDGEPRGEAAKLPALPAYVKRGTSG